MRNFFAAVSLSVLHKLAFAELGGTAYVGHYSGNRDLDSTESQQQVLVNPKANFDLDLFKVKIDGLLQSSPGRDTSIFGLREAYVQISDANYSLKLGRQIIRWTESDFRSSLEKFLPNDFTLLSSEQGLEARGVDSASLRWGSDDLQMSFIYSESSQRNMYPLYPILDAGIRVETPSQTESSIGMKLTTNFEDAELSIFAFEGYSHALVFQPAGLGAVSSYSNKESMMGLEFLKSFGDQRLRVGYEATNRDNRTEFDQFIGDTDTVELSVESKYNENISTVVQYDSTINASYSDLIFSNPLIIYNHAINGLLTEKNEYLRFQLTALSDDLSKSMGLQIARSLEDDSTIVGLRLKIDLLTNAALRLGFDYFNGEPNSLGKFLVPNKIAFIEMSFAF